MQQRDVILTIVSAADGRRDLGRTSLQKAAFFASIALGRDFGHSAYYYGPYSGTVEADTEALVASGLVDEASHTLGLNRRGYPITQYQYSMTESGRERLEQLRDRYGDEVALIESLMTDLLRVVGSLDQTTLAAAAKTLYIAREQGKAVSAEDVADLAKDYGWELAPQRVVDVAGILKDLHFVKVDE